MPDYYPESDSEESMSDHSDSMEHEGKEEMSEYESFMTPKSALGPKSEEAEVGSEWVFRVAAIHGDEIEWEYATEDKEKPKSAMDESIDDMDKMMEK